MRLIGVHPEVSERIATHVILPESPVTKFLDPCLVLRNRIEPSFKVTCCVTDAVNVPDTIETTVSLGNQGQYSCYAILLLV